MKNQEKKIIAIESDYKIFEKTVLMLANIGELNVVMSRLLKKGYLKYNEFAEFELTSKGKFFIRHITTKHNDFTNDTIVSYVQKSNT
jgi:predicted transcriptional regulator